MTDTSVRRTRAWSRYWATGAAHSCSGSFALEGDGAVARFWREAFAEVPAGGCILDLGTGNGGLLQIAWNLQEPGMAWKMVGVDLAEPSPAWFVPERHAGSIRFHGRTAMEELPLADASVDLLVSQFGIEYADRKRIQAECLRVLGSSGRMALLIHHADSAVSRVAADESRAQAFLLANGGLLDATEALLPYMALARTGRAPGSAGEQARARFNSAMELGANLSDSLSAPDLLIEVASGVQRLLAAATPDTVDALRQRVATLRDELSLARLRTGEQLACAMTESDLDAFLHPLTAAGCRFQTAPLHEAGHLLAWAVKGARSG